MVNVLVVEDEKSLNDITCMYLRDAGYEVTGCLNANAGYNAMYGKLFDLVISDIMMPGIDGYEFAATVRSLDANIPIMFMTARDDIASKKRGFHTGIDDYIVKPVDLDELVLRVEALLRRAHIEQDRVLKLGDFEMNVDEVSATLDGGEVPLTVREFNILYKLLSYPRQVFSRAQLMDEFWGSEGDGNLRAVDVYITKLRQKLAGCKDFEIVTVRGLGYKAVPQ